MAESFHFISEHNNSYYSVLLEGLEVKGEISGNSLEYYGCKWVVAIVSVIYILSYILVIWLLMSC